MFTVAIPIYNHARYLRQAVYSSLASSLVREILLVDDGSADGSAEVARSLAAAHPDRIRDLSEPIPYNQGAHTRLNQLCRAATQPWIAVLNSDDYFIPQRFESAQLIIRLTGCDLLAGALLIINEEDRVIGTKRGIAEPEYDCPWAHQHTGPLETEAMRLLLAHQNFIATTSNMLFRRSLFDRIGGFADLRYAHDWDFALRATMEGRCHWTPNFLTAYRLHQTNTIKEKTPHLDGEIARFFYRFLSEHPSVLAEPHIEEALQLNRYLAPFRPLPFIPALAHEISAIGAPRQLAPEWPIRARLHTAFATTCSNYDFILLSSTLDELPGITARSLDSAFYVINPTAALLLVGLTPDRPLRGRLVRIPLHEQHPPPLINLSVLVGWENARFEGSEIIFGVPATLAKLPHVIVGEDLHEMLRPADGKPTCLVLPMFMAVGGVERNTVEMIRKLQNDFHFVVVTTERLSKHQGSLHYQLDELEVPTIDLAEIAHRDEHFSLIGVLKALVRPQLIWICNGSPWLIEHALDLRRLFATTPIIDQQAYDAQIGWISHYHQKGVQSFDRFIAINTKIRKRFLNEIRIPAHRVDLIYSAINSDSIAASCERPRGASRAELPCPATGGNVFSFIGRLTDQKRPLLFLEIAGQAQAQQLPDQFLLIGGGELEDQCLQFIASHELTNVTRIPFSSDTVRVLAAVDGLIITSVFEGLPIVMLESLAVGTPVFSTDVGDIQLILEEYGSGTVASTDLSPIDLYQQFVAWRNNLESFKAKSNAARTIIQERFSSMSLADAYRQCFNSAQADHAPKRGMACHTGVAIALRCAEGQL